MADEPAPDADKPKDVDESSGNGKAESKPDEQKPPDQSQAAPGRSIGSVVTSDRLAAIAGSIATQVQQKAGERTIVIVEDRGVAISSLALGEVSTVLASVDELLATIDGAVREAPGPPPVIDVRPIDMRTLTEVEEQEEGEEREGDAGAAEGGDAGAEAESLSPLDTFKQVADVLKLFASTIEVSPQDVSVDRAATMAAVAGRIEGKRIVWPSATGLAGAQILAKARTTTAHVLRTTLSVDRLAEAWNPVVADVDRRRTRLVALSKSRDELVKSGDQAAADRIATEIAVEERRIKAATLGDFAEAVATITTGRATVAAAATRLATLTTPGPTGLTPIQAAAMREHVEVVAGAGDWAALWVDVTAMGGDQIKRTSPLGWSAEVSYLGAAQATYLLVAKDGQLLASDARAAFGFRVFDFDGFYGSVGTQNPWRAPRLVNLELLEIIAVIVVLVIVLLIIQAIFA